MASIGTAISSRWVCFSPFWAKCVSEFKRPWSSLRLTASLSEWGSSIFLCVQTSKYWLFPSLFLPFLLMGQNCTQKKKHCNPVSSLPKNRREPGCFMKQAVRVLLFKFLSGMVVILHIISKISSLSPWTRSAAFSSLGTHSWLLAFCLWMLFKHVTKQEKSWNTVLHNCFLRTTPMLNYKKKNPTRNPPWCIQDGWWWAQLRSCLISQGLLALFGTEYFQQGHKLQKLMKICHLFQGFRDMGRGWTGGQSRSHQVL